ncbi:hypothetical protein AY599_21555 [Leptolyngbya valderiana BDU 20041]|nr:hypothetical protein AY599_21555 [Leptolyngbya valderiana BDU 20041]
MTLSFRTSSDTVAARPFTLGLAACAGIALTSGLVALMLVAGVADQEEYQVSVFSALLNAESLRATGAPALWTNFFGFGTVLPLGHSFNLHPVFLLWPNAGLPAIFALFWMVLAAGAVCLAVWLRHLGVSRSIALVAVLSYALGTPVLTYMVANDWPSGYLDWSLMPVLFLLFAVMADRPRWRWICALWLGAVGGFLIANGHPGHVVILFVPLAVYALSLAVARPGILLPTVLGGAIAAAANLETLMHLTTELERFPADLPRDSQSGYVSTDYLASLVRPFVALGSIDGADGLWTRFLRANADVRVPFLGLGFAVGVIALLALLIRRHFGLEPHRLGLLLAFAACLLFSLLDPQTLGRIPSGAWLFRDGLTLTGLAAGALGLEWLRRQPRLGALVGLLLGLQAFQSLAIAVPPLHAALTDDTEGVFSQTGETSPTLAWLGEAAAAHGPRILMAPSVSRDIRMRLSDRGVYAASDLVLAGLHPVNGWFKGTSQDLIAPSRALMHGLILTPRSSLTQRRMLEIAGIDLLLAYRSEAEAGLLPDGLRPLGAEPGDREDPLLLFAVPDAWPRVALLPPGSAKAAATLPRREDCPERGLLCLDFSGFPARLTPNPGGIAVSRDRVTAEIPPGPPGRLAFVSQLHRQEWRATVAGEPAEIVPLANGALIGVPVPPEGGRLNLVYDTGLRETLWWLGALGLAAAFLAALLATVWRRRKN